MPTESLYRTIADDQQDMRVGYFGGAPGMLASSVAWLTAGVVAIVQTPERAVWALFIGGMLIHPVAILFTKAMGRSGAHRKGNPLGALAMATTVWMLFCLPLAYVVSRRRIEWFFPAMLLVIGGRYLTFATVFGSRVFVVCGAALALSAYGLVATTSSPSVGAFAGAAIEAAFAMVIFGRARRPVVA
ncbi:DUF7010 family protein [Gemmatimonas sp.]|uniref:DUF7010 family protein n=1 Tax=Gemmatimonas sp. TaxID=1962908 RepID=UPI00398364B6